MSAKAALSSALASDTEPISMQPSAMDIFFVFIACLRLLLEVSDSRRPSWSPAMPVDFRQKIWRMPVMIPL
jgi:hypothetical protein